MVTPMSLISPRPPRRRPAGGVTNAFAWPDSSIDVPLDTEAPIRRDPLEMDFVGPPLAEYDTVAPGSPASKAPVPTVSAAPTEAPTFTPRVTAPPGGGRARPPLRAEDGSAFDRAYRRTWVVPAFVGAVAAVAAGVAMVAARGSDW